MNFSPLTKRLIIFHIIFFGAIALFLLTIHFRSNPCTTVGDTLTLTEEELVKCEQINFLAI